MSKSSEKVLMAHSLGNMLVSAARQDCGLVYERYMMLNAAVPIEAYDWSTNGITATSKHNMTPEVWRNYPDFVRANHWYELFPTNDTRNTLTWKGRFRDVDKTVNFYSSKDEVVANGDGKEKSLFGREFAWYNQERKKGKSLVDFIPEAGWVFGENYLVRVSDGYDFQGRPMYHYRHYTATEAETIPTDNLKVCPLFRDFTEDGIYGDGGHTFLTNAANRVFRWRVLSHGIPAESFAVGANPVPKWADQKGRNVDMAHECCGEKDKVDGAGWVHSYFIAKPLCDTSKLYEKLVNLIGKPEVEETK